jgi:hypothetical protein
MKNLFARIVFTLVILAMPISFIVSMASQNKIETQQFIMVVVWMAVTVTLALVLCWSKDYSTPK